MKGDFTRDTFRPSRHFSRVLLQQGRVLLDADFNEQSAITLHYLRTLAADLIGPHGGPRDNQGFHVVTASNQLDSLEKSPQAQEKFNLTEDFWISLGHYYVDGILCENQNWILFTKQPFMTGQKRDKDRSYLVFLDVWERHVSPTEDESIHEVALGQAETATRVQVVWQVQTLPVDLSRANAGAPVEPKDYADKLCKYSGPEFRDELLRLANEADSLNLVGGRILPRGRLKALAKQSADANNADPYCSIQPDLGYRGLENQLYRVEIHGGGVYEGDADGTTSWKDRPATFKWSRENGSVVFPIAIDNTTQRPSVTISYDTSAHTATAQVELEHLGRSARFGMMVGDWVELVDDYATFAARVEPLRQVVSIEDENVRLHRTSDVATSVGQSVGGHVLLRRWDHRASPRMGDLAPSLDQQHGVLVVEGDKWVELEAGVQIQFTKPAKNEGRHFRHGDYWLIPARTVTGDVEWPGDENVPEAVLPYQVEHHYAPLAVIGEDNVPHDCRRKLKQLWE